MKRLQLSVNPIDCEAHGLCAELLPERIQLDEWGYPMLDSDPLDSELVAHARRAVAACPTLALRLAEAAADDSAERRSGRPARRTA